MHVLAQHVSSSSTQTETVICVDNKMQVKKSDFTDDKNVGILESDLKLIKYEEVYWV